MSNRTESGEKLRGNHSDCECTLELTGGDSRFLSPAKLLFALLRELISRTHKSTTCMHCTIDILLCASAWIFQNHCKYVTYNSLGKVSDLISYS